MKAIVLAAGYATRLYPYTLHTPKALLHVAGQSMLDHLIDSIRSIEQITTIVIVSNHKFYDQFKTWSVERRDKDLIVLNDGTIENGTRLGAIGDIQFAIDQLQIDEDIMVVASDNFLKIDFTKVYRHYLEVGAKTMLLGQQTKDLEMLRRFAVAKVDGQGKVLQLVEKPDVPEGDLAIFALYLYPRECVCMIKQYIEQGNNSDAPGHLPPWLLKSKDVYVHIAEGPCYDIGTVESLALVRAQYHS